MEVRVVQYVDKGYYEEFYSEWLKYKSRFKKWELLLGIFLVLISILVYILFSVKIYLSVGVMVYGLLLIYQYFSTKKKWLNDRLKSKLIDCEFNFTFNDSSFYSKSPYTEASGDWSFFNKAIETDKGVFLIPENMISIYLQKKSFEDENDILKIIDKINKL